MFEKLFLETKFGAAQNIGGRVWRK